MLTRDKIELGGLVVKAGLRETDKAVMLGILMEAASKLSSQDRQNLTEVNVLNNGYSIKGKP